MKKLMVFIDDLINIDVQAIAQQKISPSKGHMKRKNSDDDYFVEETLLFTYNPFLTQIKSPIENQSPQKQQQTQPISSLDSLIQSVEELRKAFLIEVNIFDEDDEIDQDQRFLKEMMNSDYPDAEIDKLLETFSMSGQFKNVIVNGEYIENDIRLSEEIRETIEELKTASRPGGNKTMDFERKKLLNRTVEIAELLGFKQDEGTDKGFIKLIFQNMGKLIDFLSSSEITVGYNGIRDNLMPMFYDFFTTDKVDETIRQEIQPDVIELLVKISKLMTYEDRADKILPIILENIRDDSDEEKRILGLELVDKLSEQLGKDVCQNFLMYEIVSLQDDQTYRVRKETVARMVNISKVLGKEIFLHILFPVYKKLASDQIWGVRRAAVETLPQISNLCPVEIKNGILIEMFKKFASDSSKWVKMAAFQFLGPFIASYEGIEPNPDLVEYYINMCEQNKSSQPDNEVPYHCAFNFPAVLVTVGVKSWSKLQPLHDQLVKDSRWKVRRTLAFSLHEIARILGPEITEKELIPVLYHFMKDITEVKEGVSVNLPKFLKVLTLEQRESYVDKLAQTQIDTQDWRKRQLQAQQVKQFSKIFSYETVHKYYVPVFFQLCQDQVAEVRIEAAKAVKNIINNLKQNDDLFNEFVQKILLFRSSNKYNLRQTYIYMCQSLMDCQEIFETYFIKEFSDMQRDRIINVRMALCDALSAYWKSHQDGGIIKQNKTLRLMVKHLKRDVPDVSDLLEGIDSFENEVDDLPKSENVSPKKVEVKSEQKHKEVVEEKKESQLVAEVSNEKTIKEEEKQEEIVSSQDKKEDKIIIEQQCPGIEEKAEEINSIKEEQIKTEAPLDISTEESKQTEQEEEAKTDEELNKNESTVDTATDIIAQDLIQDILKELIQTIEKQDVKEKEANDNGEQEEGKEDEQ